MKQIDFLREHIIESRNFANRLISKFSKDLRPMKRAGLALLLCLFTVTSVRAQEYAYIRDNDMYTNLRKAPSVKSEIISKLYNLQFVKILTEDEKTDGWKHIESKDEYGYVHESRLVYLPERYVESMDSIWPWHDNLFAASTDCPEIVVHMSLENPRIGKYDTSRWDSGFRILSSPTYDVVKNLATGKELESFNEIAPVQVTIYPGKLIFSTSDLMYSYYRNRNNKTCRGLTLLNTRDNLKITPQEQNAILTIAQKIFDATKHLDWEITKERHKIESIFDVYIGTNNFEYLTKLEQLYFGANEDASRLYPYILKHFSLDGAGSHTIEDYWVRKWAFDNRGEVEIE